MNISPISLAEARNKVRWLMYQDLVAIAMTVWMWFLGRYELACSFWILSEIWKSRQAQYHLYASRLMEHEEDGSWPWCEACKSYHHPQNPTCKERL